MVQKNYLASGSALGSEGDFLDLVLSLDINQTDVKSVKLVILLK